MFQRRHGAKATCYGPRKFICNWDISLAFILTRIEFRNLSFQIPSPRVVIDSSLTYRTDQHANLAVRRLQVVELYLEAVYFLKNFLGNSPYA